MATHTWPDVLSGLVRGEDLSADQTAWAMGEILAGAATPVQIAGFAVALRAKGETVDEMQGLVDAMYAHATPISVEGRTLHIQADQRSEAEKDYLLHEWTYGPYERDVELPQGFAGGGEATLGNGQLAVRVTKGDAGGAIAVVAKP